MVIKGVQRKIVKWLLLPFIKGNTRLINVYPVFWRPKPLKDGPDRQKTAKLAPLEISSWKIWFPREN